MTSSGPAILPALDDGDFAAFLAALRPVPPATSLAGFEGYVTALVVGPRFVDPRRWIPLFAGATALMAPIGTRESAVVQSIAATYNRLSAGMADFPDLYRPRFEPNGDGTSDGLNWVAGFFTAAEHAPRLWQPMLSGHPETGNLIAPIRAAVRPKSTADDVRGVARAVLDIRDHFMPRRVRQAKRR